MKNLIIVCSYSLYLVLLFGLFLHTSSHPQLFGKYTYSYAFLLFVLAIGFPLFVLLLFFLSKPTKLKIHKRKYAVSPVKKILFVVLLFCLLLTPFELLLRSKYALYEQNTYRYTIANFHPFLQFVPTTTQNTHINSWGFRANEITKQKPKNTYRIFVLGGSTVFNGGISYEKTITKRLEDMLSKQYPEKKIEVINAGVDGYTSEHSLIQYLFSIKDFSPDMIIMWHGINDWYYSCSPKQYAYTSFKSDYAHHLGGAAQMAFSYFKPAPLLSFHSLVLDQTMSFLKDNLYSDILQTMQKKYSSSGIYSQKKKQKTYSMHTYDSLVSYKRNIQSFITAAKSDNVTLLLGNQAYLYKKHMSNEEQKVLLFPSVTCMRTDGSYPDLSSMILAMETFNNATEAEAKKNTVPFINLEKALPKNLTYFTDDVHYTEKGNEMVAKTLYNIVVQGGYIH